MAVVTPPLFQSVDSYYGADALGLPYRDLVSEGVVASTDLAVSERGAGANLSVDVAAGVAWILGDEASDQPTYRCVNDATVNLAISAADATNPRIDKVIAEVRDAAFAGVSTDWRLRVITGTPAGSPSVPATPNNAIALASISVPALDTTIANAQITDLRPLGQSGLVSALPTARYVTTLPTNPYDGQEVYYAADASNGVIWHLRYRAAASGSYKWDYLGGPPMWSEVTASQTTNSGSYAALATAGPSIALPLAGDYDVALSCKCYGTVAAHPVSMSYDIGGTGAVDADRIYHQEPAGSTGQVETLTGVRRKTGMAAVTLTAKYKSNGANAAEWWDRRMAVTPVRVG